MMNILISGVGGDVAQGVIKCLEKSSLNLRVYKLGHTKEESWLYRDEYSYVSPPINSEGYVDYLCEFIQKHQIQVYIPCIDSEILKISKSAQEIRERTGAQIVVGEPEKILICEDKYKTFLFLKNNGFCYPDTHIFSTNTEYNNFPYVLKSRTGCGSRQVCEIHTKEQLKKHRHKSDQIIQERIDGDEYTAGIYLGKDKEIKGTCILKRKLKCGATNFAERVIDKNMESYLGSIAKKLGLSYVNIQFRMKDGYPCPFEFNGRFSGTTGIISKVFNAPEFWLKENVLGDVISPCRDTEKFYVMRYNEEIYATEEQVASLLGRSQ